MSILRNCFTMFPGIGPLREQQLRDKGCRDWLDILNIEGQLSLFTNPLNTDILEAEERYAARDVAFFYRRLPRKLAYLLCLEFPDLITFVDIESTGLSRVYHTLTLLGWSSGPNYRYELVGRNRSPANELADVLTDAPIVVTFNGTLFDLPFLRSRMALPAVCHVDLRFLAHRLGFSGGQKDVETQLGIIRPKSFAPVRGEDAPALWFRATRGDLSALRRLIEYNFLDVVGMARILRILGLSAVAADHFPPTESREAQRQTRKLPLPKKPILARDRLAKEDLPIIARDAQPVLRFQTPSATVLPCVVGLDLTGSEKRGSGIAAITGARVEVATLGSDSDILEFIRRVQPRLVSIDAPLSLPVGRTRVTDDDPARYTAGIMRWAERELKRRGVNVYPSLIPSMQRLTERGINLSSTLRREGIPTIESYPGAAQDILSMPRKGVGLDFLRRSLEETRLMLPNRPCNHDELDAITSAIVGILFLDGRYEALGNEDEDPMIIPQLERVHPLPVRVIALSGGIGAGKTTAGRWLEAQGWSYGRYSQVVEAEARHRGLPTDRPTLQRLGEQMHLDPGQREIGKRLLRLIGAADRIVIDGIRFREDVAFLRERFDVRTVHAHLSATELHRRERYVADGHTKAEFNSAVQHPVEAECLGLSAFADAIINNDGNPEELHARLELMTHPRVRADHLPWVELLPSLVPSGSA